MGKMRNLLRIFLSAILLTGCVKTQEILRERFPKEESFERAEENIKKRLFDQALKEYRAILSLYPEDFETKKKIAYVYYKRRDWENAVIHYEDLITHSKERDIVLKLYDSKKRLCGEDSLLIEEVHREMKSLAKTLLDEEENREEALSTAYELFFMADTETLSIKPFKNALLKEFPDSKTGYSIIVNEFYNGVYPIWRNDTVKVPYLEKFLEKYPVSEWRFTVYQYLMSSLSRLKAYDKLIETGEKLILEEKNNPFSYNYYSYLLVESQKRLDDAIRYAERAVELEPGYEKPKNLSEEQWRLNKTALYGDSRMVLARALVEKGRLDEAKKWIEGAIKNTEYGVDDYKSRGPYYYILGLIQERKGEEEKALLSYGRSLTEGDVNNKWTVKADSAFTVLYRKKYKDDDRFEYIRNTMDYHGTTFTDITEEMGLMDLKTSRIAWGDYNNDGYDDILLNGSRIFLNRNGKDFEEVTEGVGISDYSASGGIWGDWNNDGMLDFYSTSGGKDEKGDRLWKQNKNGSFVNITEEVGSVSNDYSTEGAGWGDYDGDGFLDLYLANYENWSDHSYYPDGFYVCRDGLMFDEVLSEVKMDPPFNEERAGRGVNWGDFDNDGDMDIYVSNYRLQENFLWRNNGDGTFTNVANLLGVAGDEVDGWWGHTIGSSWGDFDNDGDLDLITANLAHPRYIEFSNMTKLYENLGPPEWNFIERRKDSGIKFEETHSDPAWGDIDNDGDLDLYITSIYEGRKSFLYENLGGGKFKDITFLAGVRVFNGWGCGFSDFDNDGDLDLFVASGSGVHLFRNDGNENNYLKVKIIGKESNSTGIGTRIIVRQKEDFQIREIQGGKGTTSQNSFVQLFGFGEKALPVDIEVRFLSGVVKKQKVVVLNRLLEIKE
jgi:tetratricopeptide (TPR) repeat protein